MQLGVAFSQTGRLVVLVHFMVTDDLIRATELNKITLPVLLDYIKAFDLINVDLQLGTLQNCGLVISLRPA